MAERETFYTRRYLSYCRAHDNTPAEQRAIDDADWPGGIMTGFILWNNEIVRKWKEELGLIGKNDRPLLSCEIEALDEYLDETYPIEEPTQ